MPIEKLEWTPIRMMSDGHVHPQDVAEEVRRQHLRVNEVIEAVNRITEPPVITWPIEGEIKEAVRGTAATDISMVCRSPESVQQEKERLGSGSVCHGSNWSTSAAGALGGASEAGRLFRDLRKLYAHAYGRVVGSAEYGVALGVVLACDPFPPERIAEFDRGLYLSADVLQGALSLGAAIVRRR